VPAAKSCLIKKKSMSEYTFSPALTKAALDDYVALFRKSFAADEKLNKKYLEWQYVSNPHGKVIGYDAFLGDELAAHYAIVPRRYHVSSQPIDGALSVNTATHPIHRGHGLFLKLATITYEAAAKHGVRFVTGVANEHSVRGFTRGLGFTLLGQARLYAGLRAPFRAKNALGMRPDSDWLDWRLANPSRRYERLCHSDGSSTLCTRIRGVNFHIARMDNAVLERSKYLASLPTSRGLKLGFSPVFAQRAPWILRLPQTMQPSPWHVIWRTLDSELDPAISWKLSLDGLSMDTF